MASSTQTRAVKGTKKTAENRSARSLKTPYLVGLFQRMAREVPAYKKFLKDNGIKLSTIVTTDDLQKVPAISKSNYLRSNKYRDLFWDSQLNISHILTSTSGSTGEPFYFARSHKVDEHSALIHERFFLQSSFSKSQATLVIVCFGMGVWIGGLITYQAFQMLAKRGHPISVITPGINKAEILKILSKLAPSYNQIILAGYPPFLKDIIDEAIEQGISFEKKRVGLVFAAEAFTEKFRDYVTKKAHVKNPLTDTINIYGSADLGTMAFETPLSILIRRLALEHPALFEALFGNIVKTPTFAQFIPTFASFEEVGGQLLVSADSAMPLFKYAIGDSGGVRSYSEINTLFRVHGIDLEREMHRAKISHEDTKLPFVFVYERIDLSATLYGLQIYPETIKELLLSETFSPFVTGRLTLVTRYDETHNQYIEVNIEMRSEKESTMHLSDLLSVEIIKNLKEKNAEYRELTNFLGARAEPRLIFWPHEDPLYFRRDIKQKWVARST